MLVLGGRGAINPVLAQGRGGASNGLLTGLVGYWGLDEAGGANNALDKHTNALTLTQANSPSSATGKVYSGARTLDTSQYFSRTSETATQVGDISFAVAAWIYTANNNGGAHIVGRWGAAGAREFVLYQSLLNISFYVSADGTATANVSGGNISASTWTLCMCWHDAAANTINIQINNGTPQSISHSTGVRVGSSPFELSISGAGLGKYVGRIGPVAFWKNRTLDAAARTALWNGGNGLAYSAFS